MKGPVANLTGLKVDKRKAAEGLPGPAGESAYQAAVRLGYRGTERQWLDSLRGPAGSSAGTTYDWAADIHAATDKAVPDDDDELGLVDSAASWAKKKFTWANLKAALQAVFDALYLPFSYLDTDGTLSADSDTKVSTQKAGKTYADARLADAKAYTDAQVVGLWDDRGAFDASVNAYPSSGGSGSAGAILKGDIWTISVAGTLPTGQAVEVRDTVRALVDTPGNTQANWAIAKDNIQTSVSGNAGTATALQTARNIDGQAFNGTADITVIAPGTHAATSKGTPVDADELPLADSAASWVLKKLTWANIKATLKAYFDTLYAPASGSPITKVARTIVSGGAVTSITFSGLDLDAAGTYIIKIRLKNATASLMSLSVYYNADTVATNYHRQRLGASGTTPGATRGNDGIIAQAPASSYAVINGEVSCSVGSDPARATFNYNNGATTAIEIQSIAHLWTNTANVTSITFSSSVASAIDNGSVIEIYALTY